MRDLMINQLTCYFISPTGEADMIDMNGDITGQKITTYTKPKKFMANVSSGKVGKSLTKGVNVDLFGSNVQYSRVITTTEKTHGICKDSLIWVSQEPKMDGEYAVSDDAPYIVSENPAIGINTVSYAILARSQQWQLNENA